MAIKKKTVAKEVAAQMAQVSAVAGTSAIHDKAMLVRLTIRRWHPHKTDRKVSDEVAKTHNSDASMGRYRKRLLAKEVFDRLRKAENELRRVHWTLTLPWGDDEKRLLSGAGYLKYRKDIDEQIKEFKEAVAEFMPQYPAFREQAKVRMNGLFNEDDYPTAEKLAKKFGVEVVVDPVPTGKDFRVDVGDQEMARVRKDIEDRAQETLRAGMRDVWDRLRDVVGKASERLNAYDGTNHSFRDSLVGNIVELIDIVPLLNVTNDPVLTQFTNDIRSGLTLNSAEVLRDDKKIRETTAAKADEILKKMGALFA